MGPVPTDGFYRDPKPQLSQGDIVAVPTTSLWSSARGFVVGVPSMPREVVGASVRGPIWSVPRELSGKFVSHETRKGLAIVVTHDCALDKEFHEYRLLLIKNGVPEDEARKQAQEKPGLDPTLLISPLYLLSELRKGHQANISQRIGYLPLAEIPGLPGLEFVAHLQQMTTIDQRQITEVKASLSEKSASVLRFKLAELFAYRSLATLGDLSRIVGHKVVDIGAAPGKKGTTRVSIRLDDGSERILEITKVEDSVRGPEILRDPGIRPPGTEQSPEIIYPTLGNRLKSQIISGMSRFFGRFAR